MSYRMGLLLCYYDHDLLSLRCARVSCKIKLSTEGKWIRFLLHLLRCISIYSTPWLICQSPETNYFRSASKPFGIISWQDTITFTFLLLILVAQRASRTWNKWTKTVERKRALNASTARFSFALSLTILFRDAKLCVRFMVQSFDLQSRAPFELNYRHEP